MNQIDPDEQKNKKFAQWSLIGAAVLALILVVVPAITMRHNNRGQLVKAGRTSYQQHCQTCHGAGGQGQDPKKPQGGRQASGAYLAPALNGTGGAWYKTDQELFDYVKKGSLDAKSPMKGFKGTLDDQKIAALLVYIQSLWPAATMKQHQEASPSTPGASKERSY